MAFRNRPFRIRGPVVLLALIIAAISHVAKADAGAPAGVSHVTAPTRYIDAAGVRIAYRRFGHQGGIPIVFFQHFAGTMDNWDPEVVDGIARTHEVILFDNAGVAGSAGTVPTTIAAMADQAIAILSVLQVKEADLLGFSMGSMIAQDVAIKQPGLVHRLVLVGSTPRGGVGMATLTPEFQNALAKKHAVPEDLLLETLFTPSAESQRAGHAFMARLRARTVDRDVEPNDKVASAQTAALADWGKPVPKGYDYLHDIRQPVLLVTGSNDLVFYTINGFNLQQHLPDAQLIIYPDTGHGPQDQYPSQFVEDVTRFLAR